MKKKINVKNEMKNIKNIQKIKIKMINYWLFIINKKKNN